MSINADAGMNDELNLEKPFDRMAWIDDKLAHLESRRVWLDHKLENGRIRDPEHARVRQGYIRLEIQASQDSRKLLENRELSGQAAEVEDLKDELEVDL